MKALLIVASVLLLLGVATNSHFAQLSAAEIPPVAISSSPVQSGEAGPEVKLVLLALFPEGFENNEMQLNAGEYLFIVGNRTGLREVNVRLDREGNEHVSLATVVERGKGWKQRLKLTPGNYLFTVDENPDWTCRIVVGR